jgi:hypothetical protein
MRVHSNQFCKTFHLKEGQVQESINFNFTTFLKKTAIILIGDLTFYKVLNFTGATF